MVEIKTSFKSYQVPSELSELTPDQYEYYLFLASCLAAGAVDIERFRVRWLSYLMGMQLHDYTLMNDDVVEQIRNQAGVVDNFIEVSPDGNFSLKFDCVVNLLPVCDGFSGPGNWLDGVSFGDFVECATVMESADGDDPREFASCCDHVARKLYHIPDDVKVPELLSFHAPMFFRSVWNAIQKAPVCINGKELDFRIIFRPSGKPKADDRTGWTGIALEVASAGLFGNLREVEKASLWEVLIYLYRCKFDYIHNNND